MIIVDAALFDRVADPLPSLCQPTLCPLADLKFGTGEVCMDLSEPEGMIIVDHCPAGEESDPYVRTRLAPEREDRARDSDSE